jgi:hypothetical protein
MAKVLGRRIEFYSHRQFGGKIPIYLSVKDSRFKAIFNGLELEAASLQGMRDMLCESIEKVSALEWIPIIELEVDGKNGEWYSEGIKAEVELQYNRYYIAKKIDAGWIAAKWEIPAKDRLDRNRSWGPDNVFDGVPYTKERYGSAKVHFLPYDEKLWNVLLDISRRIEALWKALDESVSSEVGRRGLMAGDSKKLLPERLKT